jgi:hypothetical protein
MHAKLRSFLKRGHLLCAGGRGERFAAHDDELGCELAGFGDQRREVLGLARVALAGQHAEMCRAMFGTERRPGLGLLAQQPIVERASRSFPILGMAA